MTDRLNALTVILERDIRVDDAEPIIAAIKMLKGVGDVVPHVADIEFASAEWRARHELGKQLLAVVYPEMVKEKK